MGGRVLEQPVDILLSLVLGHYFGEINPSANADLMLSQHRN